MSKELEALESIRKTIQQLDYGFVSKEDSEDFILIENALNDNYYYKYLISQICDYMGLDINPLENLVRTKNEMKNYIFENECFRVDVATNKNKLKALEIIKKANKEINDYLVGGVIILKPKNQEEYDLLKEVLL